MLAMCEGDWVELGTAQDILEGWFAVEYSDDVFWDALDRLIDVGMIVRRDGVEMAEIRTTAVGEHYLATTKAPGC